MNIVYLGSGQFGIECLEGIADSRHALRVIVTGAAHRAGRGQKIRQTAVCQWAKEHSVELLETENVNSRVIIEKLRTYQPDLLVVIAFGQKISRELINTAGKEAINVHASLLPKYRGAAPINWAIVNGEKETGISIITLADQMDAGEVIDMEKTDIMENETAGELHDRLAKSAVPVLLRAIDNIEEGSAEYVAQDHSKATLARKLKKSDGYLDFNESADVLQRKILGFWPWPGASAEYHSIKTGKTEKVTLAFAEPVEVNHSASPAPGTFDNELNVRCGQGALRIKKLKPAGGRVLNFKAFVNGRHTIAGDQLRKIEE